jgi:hypothetical protein
LKCSVYLIIKDDGCDSIISLERRIYILFFKGGKCIF